MDRTPRRHGAPADGRAGLQPAARPRPKPALHPVMARVAPLQDRMELGRAAKGEWKKSKK